MKQMIRDMLDVLRDIREEDEDYARAQWALKNDISLFDFDEWCNICHLLDEDIPFEDICAMNEYVEEWNDLPENENKPFYDWDWMSYGEEDTAILRDIHDYCITRYKTLTDLSQRQLWEKEVRKIVAKKGEFREHYVLEGLNGKFTIEQSETWNDEHKVLNVLSGEENPDGYRSGFAVDLVTKSICG